jgi:hypothetical protein
MLNWNKARVGFISRYQAQFGNAGVPSSAWQDRRSQASPTNTTKPSRVGWAEVRKPNLWGHHRPMNVGLRTSAQLTGSPFPRIVPR